MNQLLLLLIPVALVSNSFDSNAESLYCNVERRLKDEHLKGASAVVELEEGQFVSLAVESFYAVERGGIGGYSCYVGTSELENKSTWSVSGNKTILEVTYNASSEISKFAIERQGNSYTIIPLKVANHYCSVSIGKWFKSITIRKGSKKCSVSY